MVDCEKIEGNWPDLAQDMTLTIRTTAVPGIYQATFDLGVIEGIMMLGPDETTLDEFCAQQDHEDGDEDDDTQDEGADEETAVGSKRTAAGQPIAAAKPTRGPPRKKAKPVAATRPRKYFVRLKSRDPGTGEIHPMAEKGTVKFNGPNLSSFTAEVDMDIGRGVTFTARKISSVATVPSEKCDPWASYSEAAYERARVGRQD